MPSRRALLAGAAGLVGAGGLAEFIHLGPVRAPKPGPDTWPQARYGPANTAANPAAGVPTEPSIDWQTVELPSSYTTGVVVGPKSVYLGGAGVTAFDRTDGARRWHVESPGHFLSYVDGTVFGASRSTPSDFDPGSTGPVAIDAGEGARIWQAEGQASIYSILGGSDALYVGDHGRLLAFDRATGRRRWSVTQGYDAETFPMIHRGTLFGGLERLVRFESRSLLDVTTLSGPAMRWETDYFDHMGPVTGVNDQVVFGRYNLVGGEDRPDPGLLAFDVQDGAKRWGAIHPEPPDDFFAVSSPAVVDRDGFVGIRGESDGQQHHAIAGVALDDGDIRWERAVDERVSVVAAGKESMVIGTGVPEDHPASPKGSVRAYARTDGRERWRIPTESPVSSLAVVDGTVFASTGRGGIMALR